MADKKIIELVLRLGAKTEAGEIRWQEGFSENEYLVSFPEYSVVIQYVRSRYGDDAAVQISIRNDEGKIIESVTDEDISVSDGIENVFGYMEVLLVNARRQAMGVDVALDNILAKLE